MEGVVRDHKTPAEELLCPLQQERTDAEIDRGVCKPPKVEEASQDQLQGAPGKSTTASHSDNPNELNIVKHKAAQEMFWAGILQAQLCMLDLQDEIDKQDPKEEPRNLLQDLQETPESLPPGLDFQLSVTDDKALLIEEDGEAEAEKSDDEEESDGERQREDEDIPSESDIEEECLFFNNPLFQDSAITTRTCVEQAFREDLMSSTSSSEKDEKSETHEDDSREGVLFQMDDSTQIRPTESGSNLEQRPAELIEKHLRSGEVNHLLALGSLDHLSPAEDGSLSNYACSSEEDTKACSSRAERQTWNEAPFSASQLMDSSELVVKEPDPPTENGLLFSESNISLVSALLLEDGYGNNSPSESIADLQGDVSIITSPTPQIQYLLKTEYIPWEVLNCEMESHCPGSASPTRFIDCEGGREADASSCLEEEEGEEEEEEGTADSTFMVHSIIETAESEEDLREPQALHLETEPKPMDDDPRPSEGSPQDSQDAEDSAEQELTERGRAAFANGSMQDREAAKRLAARLYNLDGFKRSDVASYLRKNNEFSQMVAEEYVSFFDFSGHTLDQALRSFLKVFVLTGETQERERVLKHFSDRFYLCSPEPYTSADAVHTLTCALLLLNTDLHGQNIGRSMSSQEFVTNLDNMNDGKNFPKDQLKVLYHSIRNEKLDWAVDEEELRNVFVPKLAYYPSSRKKNSPFLDLPPLDHKASTYYQGILSRKIHADIDGKKTPWGKRSWKDFYAVLKGFLLYLLKDEYRAEYSYSEEVISIHHAFAQKASKYTKRANVFRLQTADWRVYLFQAQSREEMNSWIARINLVAAMFSAPPFPAAIGSQKRFVRPILPTTPCKNSLEDQRQSHESWMDTFTDDLADHQRKLPDKKSKARDWEEYRMKEEYLQYEKIRYETYVKLLDVRISSNTEDLEKWEALLSESRDGLEDSLGLKKSHSSPSLNQEQPTVVIKVKRNISERRTVRKIIPKRNKNLV
ncbi:PH and SEC7 domain-containing protein 4-like [Rhinatrema bivittatum]|uniref:PH and SEC7 domain-containing protein 4-like n=1 Tax=Rhinatrema bivittatum TaxID=194408 RepID=UPI001129314C|nr:PH and SEC7 domain-containing protein 4-like [Rhinatrema bivittatum]XP_029460106.1 PH and SEC7 domain-containing protein 4-like [Rhinatrema bivittatum]XP_029460107.1 PH and SEC7 domain-containing protein 4-like [Rhinatrema bivittatum]